MKEVDTDDVKAPPTGEYRCVRNCSSRCVHTADARRRMVKVRRVHVEG